jgi:hypothetical protein
VVLPVFKTGGRPLARMEERYRAMATAAVLVGTIDHATIEQERSGDSGFVQDSEPCCCQNRFISFEEGEMSAIDSMEITQTEMAG